MMQRVCDACGKVIEKGAERNEVTIESKRGALYDLVEEFHDECMTAEVLAERIRHALTGDASRTRVTRRRR